jgi:FHS family L-fucose permease-like MFS transporter
VGAEVSIGSHIINYLEMPSVMSFDAKHAGSYVAYYWGGAMVGRFLGTLILSRVYPGKVLGNFALGAVLLIVVSVLTTGWLSMWSLLAIGLANSIMFPTIFTLAIKGLGKYTDQASGILCTAIVGGAFLPLTFGFVADSFNHNLKIAMVIPFVCYLFISYYGFNGHKVKN